MEKAIIDLHGRKSSAVNAQSTAAELFRYPLLTFKVITLIHYHALRLFFKGVKYIPRPQQHAMRLSQNDKDDKNVISSPSAAQPKTDTMAKDKDERL